MSDSPTELVLEVTHRPSISFAMEQVGFPIVEEVRVRNVGQVPVQSARLVLQLAPDLGDAVSIDLPHLSPGADVALGVLDLPLPPGRLRTVVETEAAQLRWRVEAAGALLAEGRGAVSVLAWNEWPGQAAPPGLLATFVTPNHPAVGPVLLRARELLGAVTGDRGLNGYQSRSPQRVVEQVRALYGALQERGLTYAGVPASFERTGQKIRLVDRVLADRIGNCLDITVLFASCLEQMGLHPMLVVIDGHAFPGVWLVDDRFPEGVVDDGARLRTGLELDQLVFWDSSATVADPRVPFERARDIAEQALLDDDRFLWALDLAVARRDRYRPMSIRDEGPGPDGPDLEPPVAAAAEPLPARAAPAPPEPVVARFERWKQRLLDLSLHNRLLAFRPETKSALPLDVPDAARFEDLLAGDAVFEVVAEPKRDARDERHEALVAARVDPAARRAQLLADLDRRRLTAPMQPPDLVARAVHLERTARTNFEEGGANTLFVAIGFLRWFEAESSEVERRAPLLLVPVTIEMDRLSRRVRLWRLPEDPLANVTLIEKMRRDFSVDLGPIGALDADDSGVDVAGLLRAARTAIRQMPRWEVVDDVALGIFSFTKFLLWRDLDENAEVLLQNPVVQHIATAQGRPFPNRVPAIEPETLDDTVPAARLPLVVDADSTQTAAVASALRGRTFVLQGPPGTGKSQTITNLVAAALAEGKTVLFVAEKMAALDVVQRRLEQAGLGDFCLELHSHTANKKAVVQALAATLERGRRLGEVPWASRAREVDAERAQLNAYTRALHAPRPLGQTFYQATARLLALRATAPEVVLALARPSATTEDEARATWDVVAELAIAAAAVEPVALHPWRASGHRAWSATLEQGLRQALDEVIRAHGPLVEARGALAAGLGLPESDDPDALIARLQLARAVADGPIAGADLDEGSWTRLDDEGRDLARRWTEANDQRADLLARWKPALLDASDLDALVRTFASWAHAFFLFAFLFLFFPRQRLAPVAQKALPPNARIAEDLERGAKLRDALPPIEAERARLARRLAGAWDGADPRGLVEALDRAAAFRKAVRRAGTGRAVALVDPEAPAGPRAAVGPLADRAAEARDAWTAAVVRLAEHAAAPVPELPERALAAARAWREALPAFRPWCLYARAAQAVRVRAFGSLVDAHAEGRLDACALPDAAERAFLEAWTAEVRDADPSLRDFDGPNRHRLVAKFQGDDRALIGLGPSAVQRNLEERLPRVAADVAESSEPGIILREARKKARHKPVRKLLQEIPNLLPRLKPCLLMSPLSVAQYLPADGRRFDLVVFDEASQICTHDAIGALARGALAVIVGDSKQLPPTSFFQRTLDDDALPDDNDFDELDSVLDEAVASGLPQQLLGWHYRSRHEALIDFSNQHYYDGRLHVFPSARGRAADLGVTWHPVPNGVYDKSRTRTNRAEAEALVAHLVADLRKTPPQARTYGVVTFSQAQQTLVADLLDEARRQFPEIEPHFDGDEAVFVKNLENVQGDERDEILFTVGYGRDEHGRLHMNFGPLNRDGGERRLNVAVTRARRKLRVFSTLTHDQIDLTRARARGARHLKEFLRYAAERGSDRPVRSASPAGDFDSDFERQVHDALVANGWRVDGQVGCGAYRIDLAVVHPDRPEEYLLGIECDGAPYHSAASARDRDRLRQQVLEGLGWRLHRVWSTDWWFERDREVARLEEALAKALAAPALVPTAAPVAPVERIEVIAAPMPTAPVVACVRAHVAPISGDPEQLHAVGTQGRAVEALRQILAIEAPLHVDDLAARLGEAFGGPSLTKRVLRRVEALLAKVSPRPVLRGEFVWRGDQDPAAWEAIRGLYPDGVGRDAQSVPPEEIAAAAAWVLEGNHALPEDDLLRETARLFGISRLGAKVRAAMSAGVDVLVERGRAAREGGQVVWRP